MKFFTEIPIQSQTVNLIDYQSKVLLLGSCFVENMAEKLAFYQFQQLQNPFGVLFQPIAIETLVHYALSSKQFTAQDLFFYNELWQSFDTHSKLSGLDKDVVLGNIQCALKQTHEYLTTASHIVITLGTAWVYRFLETGFLVANCHKVPQKAFAKELLSNAEIKNALQNMVQAIKNVNPKATVLFTVSPIRHTKDGFTENTRSKAHLIAAIHDVIDQNDDDTINYFPAYEIMMDELRDYRFYTADLIHPNAIAIQYIWDKFVSTWFSSSTQAIMKEVSTIQNGLKHRPFNPDSESYKKFLLNLNQKINKIQERFPDMKFDV